VTLLPLDRVVRDAPGWYAGDFHCHTHHSDGELSPTQLLDVARQEQLDFFTITDHNTTAAYAEFGDPDDMLIVPGLEVTFDHGHFNVFGIEHALPWAEPFCPGPTEIELGTTDYRLDELVQDAATAGLVTSLNHPLLPPWAWVDPQTDLRQVHCVEIWNDPSWPDTAIANPAAVELWTRWLNAGHRITAIGGSDYHRPRPKPGTPRVRERLGRPRTVVYAENLSGRAVLEGLRRRQAYMTMGPVVTFSGLHNETPVAMGQDLGAVAGALHLSATVELPVELPVEPSPGASYTGRAMLVQDGMTVAETQLAGGRATLAYTAQLDPATPTWFRLDVHAQDLQTQDMQTDQTAPTREARSETHSSALCWAVTNPIFAGPTPTPRLYRYGDFVETPVLHRAADRLQWPQLKPIHATEPAEER
jgi:hypothetical protein